MRVVIQRSKEAAVSVNGEIVGSISKGYVLLVGITHDDTMDDVKYVAKKVSEMRIFEDDEGKMNRSIQEVGGEILSVSQFTLYADTKRGRRPSFIDAAKPELAKPLWEAFNEQLKQYGLKVETGIFGAEMKVSLINDGPVTIIVESKQ